MMYHSQKRFKKFVEQSGYGLVNGKVVTPGETPAVAPTTPKKPSAKGEASTPASGKKRKVKDTSLDEMDSGENKDGLAVGEDSKKGETHKVEHKDGGAVE